jgi:hypothetical protein
LTVLVSKGKLYEEKAHDPFHMYEDKRATPFQFQLGKILILVFSQFCFVFLLEYLPDEECFFILSRCNIVKAERRDYDDHIDFLINKKKFDEAIIAYEKPPNANERPRRHNQQVKSHLT